MPRASVIIPTYNRPDELSDCIYSVLRQTVKPYELVVVDDGNLESLPWRAECEAAGIRCLHVRKESPGLVASRKVGVKASSGDVIFFLDDDVELFPDYIEQILRTYEEVGDGRV
ncbi:MAG: glycosyltransferase family 2 protein, partial [Planctomycetes bacterium]|nr:glycosyltransferase family 2 protein [Planctomycetota bacterium]